jgi:hypothetical protein
MATSTFFPTAFPKYATTTATIHKHKRRPDFHSYTEMKFSSNPESKPKKNKRKILLLILSAAYPLDNILL